MSDKQLHFNDEIENEVQVKIDDFLPDLPIERRKSIIPFTRFTTYWACIARTWIKLPVPTLDSIEYLMDNVLAHDLFEMSHYDEPVNFFRTYYARTPELAETLLNILPEGKIRQSGKSLIMTTVSNDVEKFASLLMIAFGLGVIHHEEGFAVSRKQSDMDELRVVAGRFLEVFHDDLKRMDIPPFRA